MLGVILGIAALVAFVTVVVKLTLFLMSWLTNKVKEKLRNRNTQKVAVGDLNEIIKNCDNEVALDELENLVDEKGATHIIADVDYSGNVVDVEAIDAEKVERRVYDTINKTGEGLVLIS